MPYLLGKSPEALRSEIYFSNVSEHKAYRDINKLNRVKFNIDV